MGTRHLTVVLDEQKREILNLYGQWDGYPSGHGADLKEFLNGFVVVNGYTLAEAELPKFANGMGCLAAQLVANFKTGREQKGMQASYYMYPPGMREVGEEYIYTIYLPIEDIEKYYSLDRKKSKPKLHIKIQSGMVTAFGMPGTPPDEMNVLYDGPVEDFDPNGDFHPNSSEDD